MGGFEMKAINFKEANVNIAENQVEYITLPAFKDKGDRYGRAVTCWKLSLWECIKVFITGKIWLSIMTFNKPLQPLKMTIKKKDVISY